MSSMLLKPIMRRPSQSIDEYRELTFVIGSPIVFQTAPPHPASNARMTCSPQFVGGADASQNGLRHLMPQNVLSSVGLGLDMLFLQPCSDADASPFAVRNRVHNLAPAVGTVSASEELRVRCLACCAVDEDAAAFKLDLRAFISMFGEKSRMRGLSN